MRITPKRGAFWLLAAGVAVSLAAVAVVIAGAAELVGRAAPLAGTVLGWGLAALVVVALGVIVARLTTPQLGPPSDENAAATERYVERLADRLRKNPACAGMALETRDDVERALRELDPTAEARVEGFSRGVFMSTAVSQHGGLETLITVAAQIRLADQLARIYWGHVTMRERLRIWRYVWSTKAILVEVEGVDILEEARPVLGSVASVALGAVPGFQVASQLLVDVLLRGGGNALFSLRLGRIVMGWCGSLVAPDPQSAAAEATQWAEPRLGPVMRAGAEGLVDRVAAETHSLAGKGMDGLARAVGWQRADPTRDYRN